MGSGRPYISYVLPAFNEQAVVEAHLSELYRYAQTIKDHPFEIIVVNDGSSDETGLMAEDFATRHPEVTVAHHIKNRGLTAAIQTGFNHARGDIILVLDFDLSYAPYHIALMLRALHETNAAIVLASAFMRGGKVANVPWLRRELSAWANRYLSIAVGGAVATSTCMVRAYNSAALRKLNLAPSDADFNYRMLLAVLRQHLPVIEIPACLEWRPSARKVGGQRWSVKQIASHTWSVLAAGLRHRPAMALAIPGLFPGILPLVVALLAFFHSPPRLIAEATAGTFAFQLLSMAFAGFLAGTSIRRLHSSPGTLTMLADGEVKSNA